jgi:hypothetical protein
MAATTVNPPREPHEAPTEPAPPALDADGRYHAHGVFSPITVGVYVVVILLLYFVVLRSPLTSDPDVIYALIVATAFLLLRYFSTGYYIDDTYLHARRILGPRRIPLEDIRKIEFMRLRDLSPTGFFGSWGYRGRMWSPYVGSFDGIYTDPTGLLVSPSGTPLFISPKDPEAFARELSRRARSYSADISVDHGRPSIEAFSP